MIEKKRGSEGDAQRNERIEERRRRKRKDKK